MRIDLITEDLSGNPLGRAYLLAEILRQDHEVRILGTLFGDEVWAPARDGAIEIFSVPGAKWPRYVRSFARLVREATGDVIYAVKPKGSSFGAGLLARRRSGAPLVLDIDDDEMAMKRFSLLRGPRELGWDFLHPSGPPLTRVLLGLTSRADALTVASRGLQARHGGVWVPHAKDTRRMRPRPELQAEAKERLGVRGERVVMFAGTPRPWKGIGDAARAVAAMRHDAVLAVIGARPGDPVVKDLRQFRKVRLFPPCPLDELPFLLEAADVVVVPQRDRPEARVQLPSKLLDGMALGKPVIGTAVSDIPFFLGDGRGVVVPPELPEALALALDRVFDDPEEAAAMGRRAREWCERHASHHAMRTRLNDVLHHVTSSS